ncbi:hypothetical protein BJV74DRAFT_881227 [Russula compacta]|nr:hypothetical protein BJV74DRAFT_881227 [Russula compacta]
MKFLECYDPKSGFADVDLTQLDDEEKPTDQASTPEEEDPLPLDHPGEEWEEYSLRLHRTAFLLKIDGAPYEAKYIWYELGWMTDNPTISGTMERDMPVESHPLYSEPHMVYGSAHSCYDLTIFKKALQWDTDTNKAISMLVMKCS